jgi:hypothetical protein
MSRKNVHLNVQNKISSKHHRKKKTYFIWGITVAVLVLCIGIAVAVVLNNKSLEPQEEQSINYVVTPENIDEVINALDSAAKVSSGTYEVKMNSKWSFRDSSQPSYNAFVANVVNNTQSIYFDVIENETSQNIYSSPIVPVGSSVKNITLNTALEPGTYACTIIYHLLDDNEESISTLQIAITIIIENESMD